jgi:hypothetical protein
MVTKGVDPGGDPLRNVEDDPYDEASARTSM